MILPRPDEGPELHDLTGPYGCSLLPVAAEMREREAARKARAARWRRSWLRRAAGWLGDILRRPDRAQAGLPGAPLACPVCKDSPAVVCPACEPNSYAPDLSNVFEALSNAQLVARRAGHRELADALHCLFLLDLTGNLGEMAPLVASVRSSLQSALGDDPGAVN